MVEASAVTERLSADPAGIARAAEHLRAGRLVAFPTETVYGLGADARSAHAVAAIFEAKRRPRFNPLIVHVADLAEAQALGALGPGAEVLARAFWPGPLTLVVPRRAAEGGESERGSPAIADLVTAGGGTLALRVPAHPVAGALLAAVGAPIAAPSANPSGAVSPTQAAHVLDGLDGRIAAVVDGGACPVGLESTIVGFDASEQPVLLRPGGISEAELATVLGAPPRPAAKLEDGDAPLSPGRLASHYAPRSALRLGARRPRPGEAWLGFGPQEWGAAPPPARSLSEAGDLREAAANLFAHLRSLDAALGGRGTIAVARVPDAGLGAAINDRLRRAAAPRP